MEKHFQDGEISIQVTEDESCRRIITVEIAPERFESEKERVLKDMAKDIALPGFRKGKVPVETVQKRFADEIRSAAIRNILPKAYEFAVVEKSLEPVGDPEFREIKEEKDRPLMFTMCIEVLPRPAIEEYRGVSVEQEAVEVNDGEVEAVVKNLQERAADFLKVERAAAAGDVVTLDFTPIGSDGTVDAKSRVTNYPVELGTGQIFPAFEEAVTGKGAGESGRVTVDYPNDYKPERLAGKKIEYEFSVIDVREKKVPSVDDVFASSIDAKFKTLAELREDIRARLLEEKEHEARHHREERAIDLLIERNKFDVPKSMRERFKQELLKEDERRREMAGVSKEEDAEKQKQVDEFFDRVALRNIKRYFLMEHIAEKEGIEVGDTEVDAELQRIAEENGRPPEEVKKLFAKDRERVENLKTRLRERKIFEIILGGSHAA